MLHIIMPESLLRTTTTLAGLLLDTALKATLLLGVAFLLAWLFRRASAATRHLVWAASILGLLILPLASLGLPAWRILPNWLSPTLPIMVAPPAASVSPTTPELPPSIPPAATPLPASEPVGLTLSSTNSATS